MKKRLLSAALALAMVLTLLPVSAFADYVPGSMPTGDPEYYGKSVKYCDATNYTQELYAGNWYYTETKGGTTTQYKVTSGFITTKGNSGAWYPDEAAYIAKTKATTMPSQMTLIGPTSFTTLPAPTTMTVDVNGQSFSLPSNLDAVGAKGDALAQSITIENRSSTKSSVGSISTNRGAYGSKNALTVKATNVIISSINLVGRGNTVELNNSEVGAISMNGQYVSNNTNTTYTYPGQRLTATNNTKITGAINIVGDSSTIQLTDTNASSQSLTVEGNGGTVTVGGITQIDTIEVKNNQQTSAAANGAPATVNVNGGTVGNITDANKTGTGSSTYNIDRTSNGPTSITGKILTKKGAVTVNGASTGDIEVQAGSLTVSGSSNKIGDVTLAGVGPTTLSITATNSKFDSIGAARSGVDLTISSWPAGRVNNYGNLTLGSGYAGHGVKGGSFDAANMTTLASPNSKNWYAEDLQFLVKDKGGATASLYGKNELTQAISDTVTKLGAAAKGDFIVMGQSDGSKYIQLNYGNLPWVYIQYRVTTGLILPTKINNTPISTWTVGNGTGSSFAAGTTEMIPAPTSGDTLILNSTSTAVVVNKVTNVVPSSTSPANNQDIRVALNGNNINLSGAIEPEAGNIADIYVDLITDALDDNGRPVVITNALINYDVSSKKVSFNAIQPSIDRSTGVIVQDGALVLNYGTGARYTVSANLAQTASNLTLYTNSNSYKYEIEATVGGSLSGWTNAAKKQLTDQIESGSFTIMNNKAVLEAINAAQATITNSGTVTTWIANARQYIWQNGCSALGLSKHTGNWKDFTTEADYDKVRDNFDTAYLVPYLLMNITSYSASGTMTATLTPYFRVDIGASGGYDADKVHTMQAGRTLGALTGDMSTPIQVEFNLSGSNFNDAYVHQNDTYVYKTSKGSGNQKFNIYKAGTNGLGTIQINNMDGPISMTSNIVGRFPSVPTYHYDTLQAAVDDTLPGKTVANDTTNLPNLEEMDTITIQGSYTGSCAVNMTGTARKVLIQALGNQAVTSNSQNVDVQTLGGYNYIIELKRNVTPVGGNITVTDVTGGTASVNVNPATVGQTVTITLRPNTGYVSNGVTVRTNATTGTASTTVPVTGSGNSYTFTMPAGSVTVTPAFRQGQTQTTATVTVSNSGGMGTTTTTAASTNNQATPGSVVGVYTTPASGYRTMSVNVSTNGNGTTAVRQGDNYFTFTVPSNATAVTVTPVYDRDNGTKFSDVWSTEYYSNPVAWAVSSGVTDGTSTYTFSPSNYCTRAQMVTFLWRAEGRPSVANIRNPFVDVSPTLTPGDYYSAILWAVSKGITDGKTPTRFAPNDIVTRGQAVTFLYRYENKPAAGTTSQFYDVPSSEYYARPVSWAANRAVPITTGKTNTMFDPNSAVTRAQAVTFLYRDKTNKLA